MFTFSRFMFFRIIRIRSTITGIYDRAVVNIYISKALSGTGFFGTVFTLPWKKHKQCLGIYGITTSLTW